MYQPHGSDPPTSDQGVSHVVKPPAGSPGDVSVGPEAEDARARFEVQVGQHLDGLYSTALRLTRNRTAAEDLVQDAMLKAWRSFHTFQQGTNIRAWLYRILMNAHFDRHRKDTRAPEIVQEEVSEFYLYSKARESAVLSDAGNPEVQVLDQVMDAEVRESLEALPMQFRAAVLLVDVEGFSYKEAADVLEIPVGTVMSRLYRGRHMLQKSLWDFARDRHYVKGDGG